MKTFRLSDVLGTNKIFTRLMSEHTDLPWSEDETVTAALLDFEYDYNHSGMKICSPAVDRNLGTDNVIETAAFNQLVDVCYMMYCKKWARNWEVLTAEYNPLNNYDMTETRTDIHNGTETNSGKDTTTQTGTDTNVRTGNNAQAHTGTIGDSGSSSTENEVSAFNSSTYEDASKTTGTMGNTRTFQDTVTDTYNNLQDQQTKNLTDELTHGHVVTRSGGESHTLTRSGNIGVMSTVQLLQQEIELWKWNFFCDVFRDIDSVFTISTY